MPSNNQNTMQMTPIGYTINQQGEFGVQIAEPYRPALKQLEHFSHVLVIWWADKNDNKEARSILQTYPPYAQSVLTGVFATRSEYRPNPIAITTTEILAVDETAGFVRLTYIDAHHKTPVVDLKAYFPVADRARTPHIPTWLSHWPEWIPEEDWSPE